MTDGSSARPDAEEETRISAIEDRLAAIEDRLGVVLTVIGAIGTIAQTLDPAKQ